MAKTKSWYYYFGFVKKTITRNDGKPYLYRYSFYPFGIHLKWFHLKVHNIVMNDDECQHDHPWSFVSLILKGGYYEWRPVCPAFSASIDMDCDTLRYNQAAFWEGRFKYGPGSILHRKPESIHRLELINGKSAWTLVITFKPVREWGFHTRFGWLSWKKYNYKQHC